MFRVVSAGSWPRPFKSRPRKPTFWTWKWRLASDVLPFLRAWLSGEPCYFPACPACWVVSSAGWPSSQGFGWSRPLAGTSQSGQPGQVWRKFFSLELKLPEPQSDIFSLNESEVFVSDFFWTGQERQPRSRSIHMHTETIAKCTCPITYIMHLQSQSYCGELRQVYWDIWRSDLILNNCLDAQFQYHAEKSWEKHWRIWPVRRTWQNLHKTPLELRPFWNFLLGLYPKKPRVSQPKSNHR